MTARGLILLILLLPTVVPVLALFKSRSRALFYGLTGALPLIALCAALRSPYGSAVISAGPLLFTFDRYSYVFVLLVNFSWLLTVIYSSAYVRHHLQERGGRFHSFLALSVSAALGAGLAANFATAFAFYFASLPMIYPLIRITSAPDSKRAARFFLLSTVLPALFVALPVAAWHFPMTAPFGSYSVDSLGYTDARAALVLALLIIGFSKTCVAPFHEWLPRSSMAPIPVTALLHSVSTIQISIVLLVRLATSVYGSPRLIGMNDHFLETGWLTYLCGSTAIYTAWKALRTQDLKRRFSLSTVGQLSYMITAILVGTPQAIAGAVLHMVTHSIAKLNLFFCAGTFSTVLGSTDAAKVAAWIPRHRWLSVAAAVSGLSIAGFPLLAGYYSKDLMLIEEIHRHHYSAAVFLLMGSVINLLYIWPLVKVAASRHGPTPESAPIPPAMVFAVGAASFALVWLSRYTYIVARVVEPR